MFRAIREKRYKWEILEIETNDILDRALIRAKANKELGAIDAPSYYLIQDKLESLKKLKFTQEYEKLQDRDTYEWMKYKVAAEVGGDAEREAFKLFEKLKVDQKGEAGYRLWRDQISKGPQAKLFIPYLWKNDQRASTYEYLSESAQNYQCGSGSSRKLSLYLNNRR